MWVVTSSMIWGMTSASEVASLAAVAIEVSRARACSASLVAVMSCEVPPMRVIAPVSSVPTWPRPRIQAIEPSPRKIRASNSNSPSPSMACWTAWAATSRSSGCIRSRKPW